ncbi:MAG: hypothetical protein KatS3mg015_2790 [Fimbriimonadales bacterium]|nr:MAG: hypothetical protein KatS3mg015_2790 [Fimbriimonadales bacterium]
MNKLLCDDCPTNDPNLRGEILLDALQVINRERQDDYGNPEDTFTAIARLWSAYLDLDLRPTDVAHLMILLKIARGAKKRDNWVDIAGYAALGYELSR